MTIASPAPSDDPTIEALGKSDRRLAILCGHCGRFRYMNGARFSQNQKVSALSETLSCGLCGSEDVTAIAVSRHPENGYWPAERS
ncbi:transcription elongation factor Elf1 [Labrenzia sp. EL_126]|nr:transcription elongation factor Elf1 [Labrenzia sp. EL_126]